MVAGRTNVKHEPTTIAQAMKQEDWRKAAMAEFDAHMVNHTWDLEPPNAEQNVIGCKWIFTTKYLPNGKPERRKGRLCANGYTQQYGIDYSETFSLSSSPLQFALSLKLQSHVHGQSNS